MTAPPLSDHYRRPKAGPPTSDCRHRPGESLPASSHPTRTRANQTGPTHPTTRPKTRLLSSLLGRGTVTAPRQTAAAAPRPPRRTATIPPAQGKDAELTTEFHSSSPPGVEKPKRFRPALRYELVGCGLHGHELLGTNARRLRPEDAIVAREDPAGFRWYRCLRCDAWVALAEPQNPTEETLPERSRIDLPLRGKPLQDRYVLRVIAADRMIHTLVLFALAAAIFLFASDQRSLHQDYTRILSDLQGGLGGPVGKHSGVVGELDKLFAYSTSKLHRIGAIVSVYAFLLGVEAVGLWYQQRWAEYLTFVETAVLIPLEIYELTKTISYLKILTLVINVAVVVYLLYRHRLFGLRGGGAAERAQHERDTGWAALERTMPPMAEVNAG